MTDKEIRAIVCGSLREASAAIIEGAPVKDALFGVLVACGKVDRHVGPDSFVRSLESLLKAVLLGEPEEQLRDAAGRYLRDGGDEEFVQTLGRLWAETRSSTHRVSE